MMKETYQKEAHRIMVLEIVLNFFLMALKLTFGLIFKSNTLITDGIDSLEDTVSSSFGLIASKEASKKADKEHQFGHLKIENLFSLILGIIIIMSAVFLCYKAVLNIVEKEYLNLNVENFYILIIVSCVAFLTKIFMGICTYLSFRKTKSSILKTQALDHFSDSFSTIITLIVISLIYSLYNKNNAISILDPVGSIIISLVIIVGNIKNIINNASNLIDKAIPKKDEEKIRELVLSDKNIEHIDVFRSRMVSNKILIEIEITVLNTLQLEESHKIAEDLRTKLLDYDENIIHVMVHVNPNDHKEEDDL